MDFPGLGIKVSVACLNLSGKYPVASAALKIWRSLLIILGGRCSMIVLFMLLAPGVVFLVRLIVFVISSEVIGVERGLSSVRVFSVMMFSGRIMFLCCCM